MNARAFLVSGLLAGLIAGLATFFVAYAVGEPHLEAAIELEEAGGHSHEHGGAESHAHDDEGPVSRGDQSTWGLLTGTVAIGVALGGIVALVAAATTGRLGRLLPAQNAALVAFLGFVSFALVPFLKYPATPPGVGSGDTIGDRTALYFGFVLVSVIAAVAATWAAVALRERFGSYGATVTGVAAYLLVVVVAGNLFAPADPVGDFPADTLWHFRLASLLTLATLWGVLGLVLTGLLSREPAARDPRTGSKGPSSRQQGTAQAY